MSTDSVSEIASNTKRLNLGNSTFYDEKPVVSVKELINVSVDLGISLSQLTWSRVDLSSSNKICIRHKKKHKSARPNRRCYVSVLHPLQPNYPPQSWYAIADCVIINPSFPHVALRAGPRLQVFQISDRQLLYKRRLDQTILFWCWVSGTVIGIVTEHQVLHWDLSDANHVLETIFDLSDRLRHCQICRYQCSPSNKWCAVSGLYVQNDSERVGGILQLYNKDSHLTQCIETHVFLLTEFTFDYNMHPSTVLCLANRDSDTQLKVHSIEFGPVPNGNLAPAAHTESIDITDEDSNVYDFPLTLLADTQCMLMYVTTKYGVLYICDLLTVTLLYSCRISHSVLFTTALLTPSYNSYLCRGFTGVNRDGQVLSIEISPHSLVRHLRNIRRDTPAKRLEQAILQLHTNEEFL